MKSLGRRHQRIATPSDRTDGASDHRHDQGRADQRCLLAAATRPEVAEMTDVVLSPRRITWLCCERIAGLAFELAISSNQNVSIAHKANMLELGDGMFIDICHQVAKDFAEVRLRLRRLRGHQHVRRLRSRHRGKEHRQPVLADL